MNRCPLTASPMFWHLDVYPTRAAAEAAKGPRGTVVESLGKVWLLTIEKAGWRPAGGERAAEIDGGPHNPVSMLPRRVAPDTRPG